MFVLSIIVFLVTFNAVPKSDCEACKFKYGSQDLNFVGAMDLFEAGCLENWRGEEPIEYVYIDIDDLEVSTTENGITNISLKNS